MTYNVNKNKEELEKYENSIYFGQWETDKIIESYFPYKINGYCIDIGAADGIRGSNTYFFENRKDWHCLCIEPNPSHFDNLKMKRNWILPIAVGNNLSSKELTIFNIGDRKIETSVTSLNPDKRLVEAHKDIINNIEKIEVDVYTFEEALSHNILMKYGYTNSPFHGRLQYDFISIDTEGTELNVIQNFPFDKIDVTLFVIENNFEDPEIEEFMNNKGYIKDQRYKINDFFIKK